MPQRSPTAWRRCMWSSAKQVCLTGASAKAFPRHISIGLAARCVEISGPWLSIDFFPVPTVNGRVLFVLVLAYERRRMPSGRGRLSFSGSRQPSACARLRLGFGRSLFMLPVGCQRPKRALQEEGRW